MSKGLRLGSLAGVAIFVDWSLLIIFGLIVVSLGAGLLPTWHPDWSGTLRWSMAVAAAVLFFASVLLHELAHALMGRAHGGSVPRITLFVFGGVSQLEREPEGWRGELLMALVGPLTSIALGVLCLLVGSALGGPSALAETNLQTYLAALSPTATLLLWLGQINVLLGLFNLVPGFPLDGGRVLRAVLWGITGDQTRATRYASGLGQAFAWLLVGMGIAMILGLRVPVFGTGLVGGLWLAFIGWFLNNAAAGSARQKVVETALAPVPVARLMLTELFAVAPQLDLESLVEEILLPSGRRAFPVVEDAKLLGLVTLDDIRRVAPQERGQHSVRTVMTPRERLVTVTPETSAHEALRQLVRAKVNQLPVVVGERTVGMLTRENLLKWMALHDLAPRDG